MSFTPLEEQIAEAYPSAEANAEGRFIFLEDSRVLGRPADWTQAEASQLWRYHLHYFEWAWSFSAHPDREWARHGFTALWNSWREYQRFGRGDAWSPYVASLRAWVWCGVHAPLVAGTEIEDRFISGLGDHARYIRAHLEFDVGGNHLLKNLKALIGLGVFLGDQRHIATGTRHLERQLAVQILGDGGHYERSPSYHCQVLGDLIEISGLLASAGGPRLVELDDAIAAMRTWLGAMLMPDGDVPLFNDCVLVGHRRIRLLKPAKEPAEPIRVLQPSGYVVADMGPFHLVADVGPPCPPDLPAHAHADCLSFELAVDGRRTVVDSGTSTYASGARRIYERSTSAHNTVEVDGHDQTEVWGVFRAARLASPRLEHASYDGSRVRVTASHDGYERLPGRPHHRRTWALTIDELNVLDEVDGDGLHALVAFLHLAPGIEPARMADLGVSAGEFLIATSGAEYIEIRPAELAVRFGRLDDGQVLVMSTMTRLPAVLSTTLSLSARVQRGDPFTIDSA